MEINGMLLLWGHGLKMVPSPFGRGLGRIKLKGFFSEYLNHSALTPCPDHFVVPAKGRGGNFKTALGHILQTKKRSQRETDGFCRATGKWVVLPTRFT
jgi:hypothetical protein